MVSGFSGCTHCSRIVLENTTLFKGYLVSHFLAKLSHQKSMILWIFHWPTGEPATKLSEHPRKDKNVWWISGNLFTRLLWIFFTWQAHHFAKIIPSIIIYIYIYLVKYTPRLNNGRSLKKTSTQRKRCFLKFFLHTQWELLISGDLKVAEANSNSPIFISYQRKSCMDERSPTWSV